MCTHLTPNPNPHFQPSLRHHCSSARRATNLLPLQGRTLHRRWPLRRWPLRSHSNRGRLAGIHPQRKIQQRPRPTHSIGSTVVSQRCILRRLECPQPNPGPILRRVPNLRRELPPRPLPHTPVMLPLGRNHRRLSYRSLRARRGYRQVLRGF